jgi:hypothetical protein
VQDLAPPAASPRLADPLPPHELRRRRRGTVSPRARSRVPEPKGRVGAADREASPPEGGAGGAARERWRDRAAGDHEE